MNFCLMCNGAFNLYFLCFLGFLLLFHAPENFFILSNNYARDFCNSRPPLACLLCNCSLEYSAFWVAFLVFMDNCRVILKLYHCAVSPPVLLPLPDYYCVHNLLSHVRAKEGVQEG